jgi:hypothetical protein
MIIINFAGRKAATVTFAVLFVAVGACARAANTDGQRVVTEQKCASFHVNRDAPITIDANTDRRIPLGGSNFVVVLRGTVPPGTTLRYKANKLTDGRAGFSIESLDGSAPAAFLKDVTLQVNYAGCTEFETVDEEFVLVKTDAISKGVIPKSKKVPPARHVTGDVRSFSEFAIAI